MIAAMQIPLYTYSRVRRQYERFTESESGSGWSQEGLDKFTEIANMVKADRELRGATFNSELYKVFKNSKKRKANKTARSLDPKKQKANIYDDMVDDESDEEDTNEPVSYVRI
jgi:hypothetical protein